MIMYDFDLVEDVAVLVFLNKDLTISKELRNKLDTQFSSKDIVRVGKKLKNGIEIVSIDLVDIPFLRKIHKECEK